MKNEDSLKQEISSDQQQKITVEIIKEELNISTETIEKGKVRFTKKVHADEQTVNIDLTNTDVAIRKVQINQIVESAPAIRHEGDVMIVPILKEVLVTEKKLMLVEEWYISQTVTTTPHTETVLLREEELIVERIPSDTIH